MAACPYMAVQNSATSQAILAVAQCPLKCPKFAREKGQIQPF